MQILVCQSDKSSDLTLLTFEFYETTSSEPAVIEIKEGMVVCNVCKRWYPIRDGILSMLPDELRTTSEEKMVEDISFLNRWKDNIPKKILEAGRPVNLSQKTSLSMLAKAKSRTVLQHESLSNKAAKEYDLHETLNPATRYLMHQEEELVSRVVETLVTRNIAIDLGCGTGRHMQELAKKFELAIGVDVSPEMVYEARRLSVEKKITNVEFIIGDAEHLMFQPATCDIVVASFGLLSFLFDHTLATNNICAILKMDGAFCATVYNKGFKEISRFISKIPWQSPLAISWSTTKPDTMTVSFGKEFEIHSKPFAIEELLNMLGQAGFDCQRVYCTPTLMPLLPKKLLTKAEVYRLTSHIERVVSKLLNRLNWLPARGAYVLVEGRRKSITCPPHDFSHTVVSAKRGWIEEELVCSRCKQCRIVKYSCPANSH